MAGKTITVLATQFIDDERPIGVVLSPDIVIKQAVAAASKYAGYGPIESLLPPPSTDAVAPTYALCNPIPLIVAGSPVAPVDWVDAQTELNQSEWAVIRPLFILYVEREQAIHLEASRNMGVDVYGRLSSEIEQDIKIAEDELPKRAFGQPVITV